MVNNTNKVWKKRANKLQFNSEKEMFRFASVSYIHKRLARLRGRGQNKIEYREIYSRKLEIIDAISLDQKWQNRAECLGFENEIDMFNNLANLQIKDSVEAHDTTIGNRRRKMIGPTILKMEGKRYGYLTVSHFSGFMAIGNHKIYECVCDCGKVCYKHISNLGTNPNINCGCRKNSNYEWTKALNHFGFKNKKDFLEFWLKSGKSCKDLEREWGLPSINYKVKEIGLSHLLKTRGGPHNKGKNLELWNARAQALGYKNEKDLYSKVYIKELLPEMHKIMVKYEGKKLIANTLRSRYRDYNIPCSEKEKKEHNFKIHKKVINNLYKEKTKCKKYEFVSTPHPLRSVFIDAGINDELLGKMVNRSPLTILAWMTCKRDIPTKKLKQLKRIINILNI